MFIRQIDKTGDVETVVVIPESIDVRDFFSTMPDKHLFEVAEGEPPQDAQQLIYEPS